VHPDRLRAERPALRSDRPARHGAALFGRGGTHAAHLASWRNRLAKNQGESAEGDPRDGRRAAPELRGPEGAGRPRVLTRHAVAARARVLVPLRGDARPAPHRGGSEARHGVAAGDGPAGLRRRGLRKDRGGHPRGLQGGPGRHAGGGPGPHDRARAAAPDHLHGAVRASRRRSSRRSTAAKWTS